MGWSMAGFVLLAELQDQLRNLEQSQVPMAAVLGIACAVLHLVVGSSIRLHQGRASVGSFDEALLLVTVAGVVSGVELVANVVAGPFISGLVVVTAPVLAFALMIWGRGLYRVLKEQAHGPWSAGERIPVVVVGAGDGGRQLILSMLRDPGCRWRPAALVDDDPLVRHRRVANVPVLGSTAAVAEVALRVGAETVIIAIPSASSELIRTLSAITRDDGCREVRATPASTSRSCRACES